MPSYPTKVAAALYPGDQITLVNDAATDSGVTSTIQAAVGPAPGNNQAHFVAFNSTDQNATIEVAWEDVEADYLPFNGEWGPQAVVVNSNESVFFYCPGPFVRAAFVTAPTRGSLILYRG
jgi:hypothetical protein